MLMSASDPELSIANGLLVDQFYIGSKGGTNIVCFIGILEFDLPKYKGYIVLVKGLYIKV